MLTKAQAGGNVAAAVILRQCEDFLQTGDAAPLLTAEPKDTGPYRVITQLGVYGFHEVTKRMMLLSLHRGVTLEQAKENSCFNFAVADRIDITEPPSEHEVKLLHEEIDPVG